MLSNWRTELLIFPPLSDSADHDYQCSNNDNENQHLGNMCKRVGTGR